MQSTVPRRGSMQFWPRSRAKRSYPSLRMNVLSNVLPLGVTGFAGYKVGMTHILAIDTRKNSQTKGEDITIPVTVVECPPLKIIGVRSYAPKGYGIMSAKEIIVTSDKHLGRTMMQRKHTPVPSISSFSPSDFERICVIAATQPHLTGVGKKTPEIFEIPLGGSVDEKKAFLEAHLGKDLPIQSVFKEGDLLDVHAVTKGKGLQGPVKRFGVSLRSHKSEKTKRGPGSLGPWSGQQHIMYRVAHAGQMGFHARTEHNKQVLKLGSTPADAQVSGGYLRYGTIRSTYLLLKGSVAGARKRLIILAKPSRAGRAPSLPTITAISLDSKQ